MNLYFPGKIIKKYSKSPDAKALAKNFISLSVLKLIGYLFPLITLPYLARVIGVDKFGEIAFAAAIIIYFQTLVDFGFNYTAVRDISRVRNDIKEVSRLFCSVLTAKVVLMIISLLILICLILLIPSFYESRLLLLVTFLYIPGYIIFPDWFFQAMEEMKYITFLNLLAKMVFTGLVFIFIKEKADYILQPLLIALGYFVSGIIAMQLIKRKFGIKFFIASFKDVKKIIKGSLDMFISLFLPNLYTNFSIILLNIYVGKIATGLYSSGYKFIELSDQLSEILSRTFYPFLARRMDHHKTYVFISFIVNFIAGICLFLFADLLVKIFYTDEFAESARIIKIMAISPVFTFLMNTFGPNYLVLKGKANILRNIVLFCSVVGFVLSWVIVPKYSYSGVAVTITLVWGIRGFLTWFFAAKEKNKTIKVQVV